MNDEKHGGFRECEHTADGEIEVWAESIVDLFIYAVRGMYCLGGVTLEPDPRLCHKMQISAADNEALLVSFLTELVFLWEHDQQAFDVFRLNLNDYHLQVEMEGGPVKTAVRQIKAVTFHRLAITFQDGFFRTRLVFDL